MKPSGSCPPFRRLCLVFWSALLFASAAFAQDAQLSGVIHDPSGASIGGATIELRNEATNVKRTASSSDDGNYLIPALQAGTYTVRVEKSGFRVREALHLRLLASSTSRLDFNLELGEVGQTVSVEATAPLLSETPENGNQVTRLEFDKLPLIQTQRMRSPAQFVFLTPGVQGTVQANGSDNTSASNQVSIHGASNYTNEYWLDGLPAGQSDTNFNEAAPGVDAVREFRLITTQLPPEYGFTGAAVTILTLNSGTNALHGSAYDYLRNDKLDARPWLSAKRPPLKLNEFGASVGGPVVLPRLYNGRDKTFFFFSYSASRKSGANQPVNIRIPSAGQRMGNFTGQRAIYDPATTSADGKTRLPFAGNVIPTNRIDPAAAKILAYLPATNLSSGSNNYSGLTGEQTLSPNAYTGKMDHILSSKQTLSGSVNHTDIPRLRLDSPLPSPLTQGISQYITSWTARLTHTYIASPRVLNMFYAGYNRFRNPVNSPVASANWASELGMPNLGTAEFPSISFSDGYNGFGTASKSDSSDQIEMVKDTLSWTRGSHALKFGGEWRGNQIDSRNGGRTNGSFSFSSVTTANPAATSTTGDSIASFLLGGYQSANSGLPYATAYVRSYFGTFVQDEWRVMPSLTLTYGLRWEFQTPPTEKHNRYGELALNKPNPAAGNIPGALIFAGRDGYGSSLLNTDYSAWGPRFGLAWRAPGNTVVRAGYGIYYSSNFVGIYSPGFSTTAQATSLDSGLTPAGSLSAGIPVLTPVTEPTSTVQNGQSVTYYGKGVTAMPRTQQWSIGIQHQFGSNLLLEANYVAMRSTRQNGARYENLNQMDPKYLSLGSLLTQNVTSAAAQAAGIRVPYAGFTGTVAQALRPFPQYQTITSANAKLGSSFYNALELHARKRFSAGLSFDASYVWSKNTGYPDTDRILFGLTNNYLQNQYAQGLEHGLMPNDVPHAVVLSYVYQLPFGEGQRYGNSTRLLRTIAGGWSLSAIQRYQSGTPLAVSTTNTLPGFSYVLRPNVVAGQKLSSSISVGDFNPTVDSRINKSAFAYPAPYTFGTAAPTYNDLRNFPVLQEDISITKSVTFTERFNMQLYGQAFNMLNRHRFTQFNANFASSSFGLPSGASTPRQVQLGLRFSF